MLSFQKENIEIFSKKFEYLRNFGYKEYKLSVGDSVGTVKASIIENYA